LAERAEVLGQLTRKARRAALRIRTNDVVARGSLTAVLLFAYTGFALALVKATHGAPGILRGVVWGGLVPLGALIVVMLHAALRQRPKTSGALALDHHHRLDDRVTTALEFASVPESSRTPLMEAAIEDALRVAGELAPAKAVPLLVPRDLYVALALALASVVILRLEVPVTVVVPPATHHVDALALGADDVELLRRMADELTTSTTDPEAQAGARRFNQIVEDLAERRLDRREVFRKLDELERALSEPVGIDGAALDDALDGVAKELEKSALSKPVAEALRDKRLTDAEHAMQDLAKKVAEAKQSVDKQKLEELRRSLQKAAKTVHEKSEKMDGARRELEERKKRLLQKKQKEGLTQAEKQELDRTERQLERLNRDKNRSDAGQQGLSGLDKDLAKAAQDLMKDLGQGSQDIQQGAQDIHRAAGQRMSEEQKKEMLRRIEELRQILRQEGQAGRDRVKRMLQFGQRAHGQQGGQGEGQGQGRGQGRGGSGQGKDGKGEMQLTLGHGAPGPGSALTMGPSSGGSSRGESGEGEGPGGGNAAPSDSWGEGHDPNLRGDRTNMKGQTEDVSAVAADTGQGASSSQVIYGAAERGFVGRGYKKVYADYQNVAEEALAKDEIPPGYRFYVRRYFQLIRPRD